MISNTLVKILSGLKRIRYPNGEKYEFKGRKLLFRPNTRPIQKKYFDDESELVRNEVQQILFFEERLKPNDVVWDIGSHYGHYTIFSASIVDGANQVFSIEPDPKARSVQLANLRLNNLEHKVQILDLLVSDKEGEVQFAELGKSYSRIIRSERLDSEERSKILTRKTVSLDSLLNLLPIPSIIKIDTEGAEIEILRGASQLLANKNVQFVCELHPFFWEHLGVNWGELVHILEQYDRHIVVIDKRKSVEMLPDYAIVTF